MNVASIRERLGANAVPVQLPLGEAEKHQGVIDLIRRRAYVFEDGSEGREFAVLPVPAEHREAVEAARLRLIEAASDFDDEVLSLFVDGRVEEISEAALERAIRKGTLSLKLVPVLLGSAFKYKGVQMLLDAVVAYLPSRPTCRRWSVTTRRRAQKSRSRRATTRPSARWRSSSCRTGTRATSPSCASTPAP